MQLESAVSSQTSEPTGSLVYGLECGENGNCQDKDEWLHQLLMTDRRLNRQGIYCIQVSIYQSSPAMRTVIHLRDRQKNKTGLITPIKK